MASNSYLYPTADFVTTTLNGSLAQGATSATIGTGLSLPATLGLLSLSYDTANAVGATNGPEVISYATYTSGTGALTGLVRGLAGTTDVLHDNAQSVQSAPSYLYFYSGDVGKIAAADAFATWVPNFYKNDGTTALTATLRWARYQQIGKKFTATVGADTISDPGGAAITISLPFTTYDITGQGYVMGAGYAYSTSATTCVIQSYTSNRAKAQILLSGAGAWSAAANVFNITFSGEIA